jgi:hypothetical protein
VFRFTVENEVAIDDPRLVVELRDRSSGILGATTQSAAELGWDGRPGAREFRLAVDHLPLTDGRFMLCVAVTDGGGTRVLHRIDGAAAFIVYPDRADARGSLRLDGTWSASEVAATEAAR